MIVVLVFFCFFVWLIMSERIIELCELMVKIDIVIVFEFFREII